MEFSRLLLRSVGKSRKVRRAQYRKDVQIDYAFVGESRKIRRAQYKKDVQVDYALIGKSRKQDAHNTIKPC